MKIFKIIVLSTSAMFLSACKYKEIHSDNIFSYDSGRYTRYNYDNNMGLKVTTNLNDDTISFHISNISKENINIPLLSIGRPTGVDIEINHVSVSHLDPKNGRFYKINNLSYGQIKPGETKTFTYPQSFISYTYKDSVLLRPTLMDKNRRVTFNFIGISSNICYIRHIKENNFFQKYHELDKLYKENLSVVNEFKNDNYNIDNRLDVINYDQFNKLPVLAQLNLITNEMNSIKNDFNLDIFNDFNSKTNIDKLFKDDYLKIIEEYNKNNTFYFNQNDKLNLYLKLASIYQNITKQTSLNEEIPEIWLDFYNFNGFDFKLSDTTMKLFENTPNVRFECTDENQMNSFWMFFNKKGTSGEYKYVW